MNSANENPPDDSSPSTNKETDRATHEKQIANLIDKSVKLLFREHPDALLALAGLQGNWKRLRFEDTAINLPEYRADDVLVIEPETGDPFGFYIEFQLKPNKTLLPEWTFKWVGLNKTLRIPICLIVLYLERGDRVTFPASYGVEAGGFTNSFNFATICLWEHKARIESGELAELAPLLVLCEPEPTEQTIRKEIEIIHHSNLPTEIQTELLGIAMLLASRNFRRDILRSWFESGGDVDMIDAMENLKELLWELGALERWAESMGINAKARDEGRLQGEAKGRTEATQMMLLDYLTNRFGELPSSIIQQIKSSDAEWCQNIFHKALSASTLNEVFTDSLI